MKGRVEHRIPLSDPAVAILKTMASVPRNEFVFSGQQGGALPSDAMAKMLRRTKRTDGQRHGFRSAFAQWAAERTNYFRVREMALAHKIGSNVERTYHRRDLFDRRRRLMDDWARFCAQPATGDVVPLRARR